MSNEIVDIKRVALKPRSLWIKDLKLSGTDAIFFSGIDIAIALIENFESIELYKVAILSSPARETSPQIVPVGSGKPRIQISDGVVCIPRTVFAVDSNYTKDDLVLDLYELKNKIKEDYPQYNVVGYIDNLILKDKGIPPNRAEVFGVFGKVDTVDPKSDVGKMLGNEIMPLDLIGLYKPIWDKKKEIWKPSRTPIIAHSSDIPFVRAIEVQRYTRNIYDSDFTFVRQCQAKKELKEVPIYTILPDGKCKKVAKYPEDILIKKIAKDTLKDDEKEKKIVKKFTEKKLKTKHGHMATYNKKTKSK